MPLFDTRDDCPGIYGNHIDVVVNSKPIHIFTGDLDGDNDQDIAVTCYWREMVSVILNNGDGTFGYHEWYLVPVYTECIEGADFDGDGDIDLVTANSAEPRVSILNNNSDGTFAPRVSYTVSGNPRYVFPCMLNNDDHIDLVTANYWTGRISVLLNNGDGTFANFMPFQAGGNPRSVFAADFDGDGDNDIVTANLDSASVSILINDGDGNFSFYSARPVGSGPFSVYADDFNGDGDIDIVSANSYDGTVSVLLNTGYGPTFGVPTHYPVDGFPTSVIASDIDDDGDLDLATANSDSFKVSILLNDGEGNFGHHSAYRTGHNPYSLKAVDLDGDDDLDLAVAIFSSNYVSLLFNQGYLPFTGSISGAVENYLAEPIEGVTVMAIEDSLVDSTGSIGEYILSDLCCDTYSINFSHPDYCDTVINNIDVTPDDTTVLDIILNFRSIAGFITDQNMIPLESVIINLSTIGLSDTSGADGSYYFGGVGSQNYNLEFSHPHYCDTIINDVSAPLNDTIEVSLIMFPRGFIAGNVTDESGQPVENILVTAVNTSKNDSTDSYGNYVLEYLNTGVYNVYFYSQYYYDTLITGVTVSSDDTAFLDVIIRERPELELWYGDVSGLPVSGRTGSVIAVDVYMQTAGDVLMNSADFILGANNQYIDNMLSETLGEYFYPFTEMSEAYFLPPYGSPPNEEGWSSQVFGASYDSVQHSIRVNFNAPTPVIRYVVQIVDDSSIVGDTVASFGPGVDEQGHPSVAINNLGDTLTLIENFNSLVIIDSYAYFPGDANMFNGIWPPQVIGSDVTYLVNYFRGVPNNQPCNLDNFWASTDANGDCLIIGSDVTRLVNYFRGNVSIEYCPDYIPQWLNQSDIPENIPFGWPNCEP